MRIALLIAVVASPVAAQELYVSDASKIVGTYKPAKSDHSPKAMAAAADAFAKSLNCLLYTSPSPRDKRQSRMPSSA